MRAWVGMLANQILGIWKDGVHGIWDFLLSFLIKFCSSPPRIWKCVLPCIFKFQSLWLKQIHTHHTNGLEGHPTAKRFLETNVKSSSRGCQTYACFYNLKHPGMCIFLLPPKIIAMILVSLLEQFFSLNIWKRIFWFKGLNYSEILEILSSLTPSPSSLTLWRHVI